MRLRKSVKIIKLRTFSGASATACWILKFSSSEVHAPSGSTSNPPVREYNRGMRLGWHIVSVVSLAVGAFCADQPAIQSPAIPQPSSKKILKQAKSAFAKGMKLQNSKHLAEALEEFDNAVQLAPQNIEYLTAREMLRQQLAFEHTERGNPSLRDGHHVEAMADFHIRHDLDPHNGYVQHRLRDT